MKKLLILFYITCLASTLRAQQPDSIRWITFEQLSDSLTAQPKKVLLFFHTHWCVYCRKMQGSAFVDKAVVEKINADYYAVRFDAESTDTLHFDGQLLKNKRTKKTRGSYHEMAKILAARNGNLVFPTTLILNPDFSVKQRYFQYLDSKKLLKALE